MRVELTGLALIFGRGECRELFSEISMIQREHPEWTMPVLAGIGQTIGDSEIIRSERAGSPLSIMESTPIGDALGPTYTPLRDSTKR